MGSSKFVSTHIAPGAGMMLADMAECGVPDSNGCTGKIVLKGITGLDALVITVTLVSFL